MFEDFAPKLAAVLTDYSAPIQKGEIGLIRTTTAAQLMIEALAEAILRRGGHPIITAESPNTENLLLKLGDEDQIGFLNPLHMTAIEKADVMYSIIAPFNTKHGTRVDPAKQARRQEAYRSLWAVYHQRVGAQELRWNVALWPTEAAAQEAEMSLLDYTEFVYRACALDQADPVAYWQEFQAQQERLVGWLKGKKRAEVKGPGIDITFEFAGRPWASAHGNVNMPDGEIYCAPLDESVNGRVAFSFPTVYAGREVNGVQLTFKDGLVIEDNAAKGEDFLRSRLGLDAGARRLGEFAIGNNPFIQQFTGETLFDEKIGGTIHMALGNAYTDVEGTNQSAIHWDMVHGMRDGGEIWIDGELFYRSGEFMV